MNFFEYVFSLLPFPFTVAIPAIDLPISLGTVGKITVSTPAIAVTVAKVV